MDLSHDPPTNGTEERADRTDPEQPDYYWTAEGYLVFTAQYHLKRGTCCGSGCRHCPFGHEGVKLHRR